MTRQTRCHKFYCCIACCVCACVVVICQATPLQYGDILVANGSGANIIRIDPVTGEQSVFSSGDAYIRPLGITVTEDGRIFVVDPQANDGSLYELDPATGNPTLVHASFSKDPAGVTVGDDGTIYVTEQLTNHAVTHIDPVSGDIVDRDTSVLFNRPMLLTFLDSGLIVVPNRGNGNVALLNPVTGLSTLLASGLGDPIGSAVDSNGNILITNSQTLYRFDPNDPQPQILSPGFVGSVDVAVEANGNILVTSRGGSYVTLNDDYVWRINPTTGLATELTSFNLLVEAFGIAVYLPPLHPGDANGDGMVNLADLQILGDNWQSTTGTWATADFTGDGNVNLADLQILGDNWGFGVGPDVAFDEALASVLIPEPTTLALLVACGAFIARRRSSGH